MLLRLVPGPVRPHLRRAVRSGAQFVLARPGLHAVVKLAYPLVPGLRTRLRHVAAPLAPPAAAPPPPPPPRYTLEPAEPPAQGTLTVEHLFHLSRSL